MGKPSIFQEIKTYRFYEHYDMLEIMSFILTKIYSMHMMTAKRIHLVQMPLKI